MTALADRATEVQKIAAEATEQALSQVAKGQITPAQGTFIVEAAWLAVNAKQNEAIIELLGDIAHNTRSQGGPRDC